MSHKVVAILEQGGLPSPADRKRKNEQEHEFSRS